MLYTVVTTTSSSTALCCRATRVRPVELTVGPEIGDRPSRAVRCALPRRRGRVSHLYVYDVVYLVSVVCILIMRLLINGLTNIYSFTTMDVVC